MKNIFKMALASFAFALIACDDSTSSGGEEEASIPCEDAAYVNCPALEVPGTILDSRDCKRYKVATFGTQTWMTQNLNYFSCSIKNESWCYGGDEANCAQYGRLYTWTAVMGVDKSFQKKYANLSGPQDGLCPAGFHVPSDAEWQALYDYLYINGKEDEFAVEFSGEKSFSGYSELGRKAYFWAADEDHSEYGSPRNAIIWTYLDAFGFGGGSVLKDSGLSLRCVQD